MGFLIQYAKTIKHTHKEGNTNQPVRIMKSAKPANSDFAKKHLQPFFAVMLDSILGGLFNDFPAISNPFYTITKPTKHHINPVRAIKMTRNML